MPICILYIHVVQYLYSYIHALYLLATYPYRDPLPNFENPRSSYPNGRPYNNPPPPFPLTFVPPTPPLTLFTSQPLLIFLSFLFFFWPLLNLSRLPSGAIILSFNFLVNLSCLILSPVVIPEKKIRNRKSPHPPHPRHPNDNNSF